jgi:cysteine-rich repeat protein
VTDRAFPTASRLAAAPQCLDRGKVHAWPWLGVAIATLASAAGCGFDRAPHFVAGRFGGPDAAFDGGASTHDGGADSGQAGEGGGDSGQAGEGGAAADAGADAGGFEDGSAGGCLHATSCLETGNFCVARACVEGECSTRDVAAGRALPGQNAGDCVRLECDGAGEVISVVDDADAPAAPRDCMAVACSDGVAVQTPVARDSACDDDGGLLCDGAGACVECTGAEQCADGVCVSGQCAPAECDDEVHNGDESDLDCGGSCPSCALGDTCASSTDCTSNLCLDDTCTRPTCGDGVTTPPELCDDDNEVDGDGCESDCTPTCGNGRRDAAEACDDGDLVGADGCSSSCQIEPFYQCTLAQPSVCTRQEGACSGGVDDDGDGLTDTSDSDCNLALVVTCTLGQTRYVFNSRRVPQALPDLTTVTNDITVPAIGTVRRVVLRVNITHTRDSNLEFWLTAPAGTTRLVSFHNGDDGDNYTNTRFRQAAMTPIANGTAPFLGEYRPEGDFNGFNGDEAAGRWRLTLLDAMAGDVGTLNAYSLAICAD